MSRNSRETPPTWVQKYYINRGYPVAATQRGWITLHPNGIFETLVAMKNLAVAAGNANVLKVEFGSTSYSAGDNLAAVVTWNEVVDVTAGASIVITCAGGDYAVGTLTASNRLLPIRYATGTLTASTNFAADDTVVIGVNTYTFKASASVDNEVTVGDDLEESLANLAAVVEADGVVTCVAGTTTLVVTAVTGGTAGNSIGTSVGTNTGDGAWGAANLAGGAAAETITVGGQTYTMVSGTPGTNEVQIGSNLEGDLENLAAVINAKTASTVTATSDATKLYVTAKTVGTAGNSIASTETCGNASWGGATLSGGAAATNITLYANDDQSGSPVTIFSCQNDNTTPQTVPSYDVLTLSIGAQTLGGTIEDATEGIASDKAISSTLAAAAGTRVVA